jgi:hypothetical protein
MRQRSWRDRQPTERHARVDGVLGGLGLAPRAGKAAGSMSTAGEMKSTQGSLAMRVSIDNFRDDPMFLRIECVVADLLAKGNIVAPVDVLIGMGLLRPEHLNNWRRGCVPYLERVINCNLTRLSRLLRILRFHAHDLNLKPSATVYKRYGKGPEQRLRFSKTGDAALEAVYATHFVWPGKRPFHSARTKPMPAHQLL